MERLPPHDPAAEEAVIGSILIDPEAMLKVAPILRPEDFLREKNRWVYEAGLALMERQEAINQITLASELALQERLESVGGIAYLSYLVSTVPTSVHAEHYARIVHRTAVMRNLIEAAGRIAALGYQGGPDADEILGQAEDLLYRLRSGGSPRDFVPIREVLDRYLESGVASPAARESHVLRVETGFPMLDALLGGLQRSDLIILAARPSLGKTSLALNIAHYTGKRGARVAVFSLEMTKEQLVERLLSSESRVELQRLRLGRLREEEEQRIIEASGVLSEAPIYVDDTPNIGIVELRSKARRLNYERGIDLVIVDYIGLVQASGYSDNRVQQMSEISRSLKALARELNVPILAVSQLSRATELRSPPIPHLADLRDSGSIEQDADVVIFIYREDAYFSREEWERRYPARKYPKGIAHIIVAKHRNGPTDQVNLYFQEKTATFGNLTQQMEPLTL